MTPGTLAGRVASASPLGVDVAALAARMRVSPGAPAAGDLHAWQQDDFTPFVTGTPPPTGYTLTFGPVSQSERVYVNGVRLRPGVDYNVADRDLTVAAGQLTAGDILLADYQYLPTVAPVAGSGTPDYWRISSNQAAATAYPGGSTWVAAFIDTGATHNDITATIATLSSGEMNLGTVKPDGRQRCGAQVIGGAVHLIYGALDASGTYLFSDPSASVATAPSTPFTLRVALTGSVLSCRINGVLQGTTLTVDATSMITYGASTKVAMLDFGGGHWDDFMTSDGVTVVDHFTRADTTSGLGTADTGQVWSYFP